MIAKWLSPEILKTIVLFELRNPAGDFTAHGSGVLILHQNVFFVATCKHIVLTPQGTRHQGLHASINRTDGTVSRKSVDHFLTEFGLDWYFHKDPKVDLALTVFAIEEATDDLKMIGFDLLEPFDDIPLGDDIFFLGYPLGLGISNVPKLSPLVRTGVVAFKSTEKTFAIDANVYPGSSGSPVFYKPTLAQTEAANTTIGKVRATRMLGIVSDNVNYVEQAVSARTGRVRTIFEENAGLGIVQSSSLLMEIFSSPEVQAVIANARPADKRAAEPTPSGGPHTAEAASRDPSSPPLGAKQS